MRKRGQPSVSLPASPYTSPFLPSLPNPTPHPTPFSQTSCIVTSPRRPPLLSPLLPHAPAATYFKRQVLCKSM